MKYGGAVIFIGITSLSGCGTMSTVMSDDHDVRRHMVNANTKCESIPRVYSGVSYDFCRLNSNPNELDSLLPSNAVPFVVADMALSGVFDTAVLPYTIYKQSTEGSVELN